MLRVAIVEDNRRFRESVELVLQHADGFEHVGSFGSVEAMVRHMDSPRSMAGGWTVVLMDIDLPGASGLTGISEVKARHPQVAVMVCTVFEEPRTIVRAIAAGADGYLLKSSGLDKLLEQIRTVHLGGAGLSPQVARTVLEVVRSLAPGGAAEASRIDLTDRERDVLRGLVDGLSYKLVADRLGISVHTVRDHIKKLYRKLQVQNVAEAVSRAIREGLV